MNTENVMKVKKRFNNNTKMYEAYCPKCGTTVHVPFEMVFVKTPPYAYPCIKCGQMLALDFTYCDETE